MLSEDKILKKYNKILNVVIIIGASFMFINYFSYLIKLFFWSEGVLPYIAAFGVVILLPLILYLGKRGIWGKMFGKIYPFLKTVFAFGIAFYTVSFVCLCTYIFAQEHNSPKVSDLPENTYIITLGAKVESNGAPGKILKRRLDTTYNLLSAREDLMCIVSGGQGSDEPISEAECMKNYLVERGISPERIIIEDKARNTIENIENTLAIVEKADGYGGFAVVTTNFHLPRAKFLCNRLGVDMDKAYFYSAPNTGYVSLYTILVREYMSYCKLFLLGT